MLDYVDLLAEITLSVQYAALAFMTFHQIIKGKNSVYWVLMFTFFAISIYHLILLLSDPHPSQNSLISFSKIALVAVNVYSYAIIRRYSG